MKIKIPAAYLVDAPSANEVLHHIANAARICYQSEPKATDPEQEKQFIARLVARGHESPLEHVALTVFLQTDRGVSHEMVRHRIASYSQESTRYCQYDKDKFGNEIAVVVPRAFVHLVDKITTTDNTIELATAIPQKEFEQFAHWIDSMKDAEKNFLRAKELGISQEYARSILPHATRVQMYVTANVREWIHIFNLRVLGLTGKPHPDIQYLLGLALKEMATRYPFLFERQYQQYLILGGEG